MWALVCPRGPYLLNLTEKLSFFLIYDGHITTVSETMPSSYFFCYISHVFNNEFNDFTLVPNPDFLFICCLFDHAQAIQDVGDFFSSVEQ